MNRLAASPLASLAALLGDVSALPATVSVEQAAEALGVGRSALYEALKCGRAPVPCVTVGRSRRIPTLALLKALGLEPTNGGGAA